MSLPERTALSSADCDHTVCAEPEFVDVEGMPVDWLASSVVTKVEEPEPPPPPELSAEEPVKLPVSDSR